MVSGAESQRRRWHFAAVVVGQLVVLYAPRAPSTGGVPGLDKVVHVLVFMAVVFIGLRAAAPRWLVALLSVVHAPVSELLQETLLANRSGDVGDLAADLVGCVLGWWVARRARMNA